LYHGDEQCNNGETCSTCPKDCGSYPVQSNPINDFSEYPGPFKNSNTIIVIGSSIDSAAATDIALGLGAQTMSTDQVSDITQYNAILVGSPWNNQLTA